MKITGMNAANELVEIEVSASEVLARLNQLKKYPLGYERVDQNEVYFTYDTATHQVLEVDDRRSMDADQDYDDANYYTDEQLALDNARADKLFRNVRRFAVNEEGGTTFTENDGWTIAYDPVSKSVASDHVHDVKRRLFSFAFRHLRSCNECIEEFRDELVWYFTKYLPERDQTEVLDV